MGLDAKRVKVDVEKLIADVANVRNVVTFDMNMDDRMESD